ncbi:porin [Massilia sp.]|uniref:porin n=1 Tax=Massilia sp. TaxID=1882437 RepID=UPI00352C2809
MKNIGAQALGLALATLATQAAAQSNVTVYGHFDLGLVKESGSPATLSRGLNNWLGFRGSEDLGGGLEATFNAQMRFLPNTGRMETGVLFQGESTVGLRSKALGALRLGRALTPFWAQKWRFDPWYDSQFMGSIGAWQNGAYNSDPTFALNYADYSRISNGVFYDSPTLAGVQLHAAAELERAAGARSDGRRVASLAVDYRRGALDTGASYERNNRGDDIRFIGAAYTLGAFTIMGTYGDVRLVGAARHEDDYTLAGTYCVGAHTFRFGYGKTLHAGGAVTGLAPHKTALGYVHTLSKRTTLFADIYRVQAAARKNGAALGMTHTF